MSREKGEKFKRDLNLTKLLVRQGVDDWQIGTFRPYGSSEFFAAASERDGNVYYLQQEGYRTIIHSPAEDLGFDPTPYIMSQPGVFEAMQEKHRELEQRRSRKQEWVNTIRKTIRKPPTGTRSSRAEPLIEQSYTPSEPLDTPVRITIGKDIWEVRPAYFWEPAENEITYCPCAIKTNGTGKESYHLVPILENDHIIGQTRFYNESHENLETLPAIVRESLVKLLEEIAGRFGAELDQQAHNVIFPPDTPETENAVTEPLRGTRPPHVNSIPISTIDDIPSKTHWATGYQLTGQPDSPILALRPTLTNTDTNARYSLRILQADTFGDDSDKQNKITILHIDRMTPPQGKIPLDDFRKEVPPVVRERLLSMFESIKWQTHLGVSERLKSTFTKPVNERNR